MTSPTRYRHLAELAADFLATEGAPRAAEALAGRLFAAAGGAGGFVRLVEGLLAGDERFVRDEAGRWGLAGWERGERGGDTLTGASFAVIDVENAGGRSERRGIVEVGVVLLDGGAVTGQYESLVKPQRPLPGFVAELTGITPELVESAPAAREVLADVRAFVGDRILVGHNVGADLAALNYEALWNDLPPFANPALDTEELALRVLPDVRRPSLARVAGALGLNPPQRHRALPDARLTAAVLVELLRRLPATAGEDVTTLEGLQAWLSSPLADRQARVRRQTAGLPPGTLRDLPDAPGVYTFHDAAGGALYVGKAASLRDRVAQHFTGTARALRRHEGLLERTAAVSHEAVGCELDALLLESARIRALRPPYNVQTRSRRGSPFLRFEAGPFPRAAAVALADGGAWCAGPYRTAQHVRHTLDTVRRVFQIRSCRRRLPASRAALRVPCLRLGQGLCPAPCADAVTPAAYAILVDFARLYVARGREATLRALDERLAALETGGDATTPAPGHGPASAEPADAVRWERHVLRECRARLGRVRREYRPVEGGLAGDDLVIAYPERDGDAVLFFVRQGDLLQRTRLPAATLAGDPLDALSSAVAAGLAATPEGALDADQANILLRWIFRRTGHPECVPAGPAYTAGEVAAAVYAALQGTSDAIPPSG